MDCPQCRRECGQNDKFCSECGYRLCSARTPVTGRRMDCPHCHRECGQNDKFCSECGYRLCSARTPVTELPVPGKETGDSTDVSFADLSRVRRNSIDWTRPSLQASPSTWHHKHEIFSKETMSYAQLQEPEFIRTVIPHLRNGIENFKALADILLEYDESKNQAIQQVIRKGKASLDQADAAASAHLSEVDKYTERLTAEKGQLDERHKNKMTDLKNLETESRNLADCMEKSRVALNDSQRSLDSAKGTLAALERKHNESQVVRDAGIGIMFIPILGTIAGAIMVGVSQTELNNALWAIDKYEEEVEKCEKEVSMYCDKFEEKKRQSMQKKEEMEECRTAIRQIERSLAQVSEQRNDMFQVQEKIRIAVNALGTLAGRAAVARTLTERFVFLPPIVNVLGEIIKLTLQLYENRKCEIFCDPQVRAAIQSLQDIYKKVSAIDDKQELKEIQFY